jgi:hypothetical protein
MSSSRPVFEADPDTFPFAKLRLGRYGNEKECTFSDFGPVHQKTYVETSPGVWEEYEIQFDNLQGMSLSYWLDPNGNNAKNPFLYWHPILYPKWSQKDPATGLVSKTKTPTGEKVEQFLVKFREALKAECERMTPLHRALVMGDERAEMAPDKFIEPIAQFNKFEKTHKTKPGQFNYDKSPGFAMTVWSQDKTKRRDNGKGGGNDSDNGGKRDKTMCIPDTNALVYTTFFLAPPPPSPTTGTGGAKHKKTKKQLRLEQEAKKKPITDYQLLKPFIYRPEGHPNTSSVNRTVVAETRVLGPSVLWKPKEGPAGKVQFKVAEMVFAGWQDSSFSKEMSDERLEKQESKARAALDEFGFVHQAAPTTVDNRHDSEEEEEEEDDQEEGGGEGMNFDGDDTADEHDRTPVKRSAKKRAKTATNAPSDANFAAAIEAVADDDF